MLKTVSNLKEEKTPAQILIFGPPDFKLDLKKSKLKALPPLLQVGLEDLIFTSTRKEPGVGFLYCSGSKKVYVIKHIRNLTQYTSDCLRGSNLFALPTSFKDDLLLYAKEGFSRFQLLVHGDMTVEANLIIVENYLFDKLGELASRPSNALDIISGSFNSSLPFSPFPPYFLPTEEGKAQPEEIGTATLEKVKDVKSKNVEKKKPTLNLWASAPSLLKQFQWEKMTKVPGVAVLFSKVTGRPYVCISSTDIAFEVSRYINNRQGTMSADLKKDVLQHKAEFERLKLVIKGPATINNLRVIENHLIKVFQPLNPYNIIGGSAKARVPISIKIDFKLVKGDLEEFLGVDITTTEDLPLGKKGTKSDKKYVYLNILGKSGLTYVGQSGVSFNVRFSLYKNLISKAVETLENGRILTNVKSSEQTFAEKIFSSGEGLFYSACLESFPSNTPTSFVRERETLWRKKLFEMGVKIVNPLSEVDYSSPLAALNKEGEFVLFPSVKAAQNDTKKAGDTLRKYAKDPANFSYIFLRAPLNKELPTLQIKKEALAFYKTLPTFLIKEWGLADYISNLKRCLSKI